MRNKRKFKKNIQGSKKTNFKPGFKKRENKCVVNFDEKDRQEYLTGFHKRKVERRKAAVDEIKKKIKEEQSRVREERHKEYMKMLKERREALEEAEDDLEDAVISKTESVQYDHPNHTVTVTTISDLDLSGAHLLGPATNHADELSKEEKAEEEEKEENAHTSKEEKAEEEEKEEKAHTMPKKARDHIVNKKIRSLTAALSTYTSKRKRKGKQEGRRGCPSDRQAAGPESKHRGGRTSKCQRRRQTGRKINHQD